MNWYKQSKIVQSSTLEPPPIIFRKVYDALSTLNSKKETGYDSPFVKNYKELQRIRKRQYELAAMDRKMYEFEKKMEDENLSDSEFQEYEELSKQVEDIKDNIDIIEGIMNTSRGNSFKVEWNWGHQSYGVTIPIDWKNDINDWKYGKIFNKKVQENPEILQNYSNVHISLYDYYMNDDSYGVYWDQDSKTIVIFDLESLIDGNPSKIYDIVKHELSHMVQYLLSDLGISNFGLPSSKIRSDNSFGYGEHSLRDEEFYPNITSAIERFKQHVHNYDDNNILFNIRSYIGLEENGINPIFEFLKKNNPIKYRKAVKIFYQAITQWWDTRDHKSEYYLEELDNI